MKLLVVGKHTHTQLVCVNSYESRGEGLDEDAAAFVCLLYNIHGHSNHLDV